MTTRSIHDYPDLLKKLDIDVNKLGTVMLPVEAFDIFGEGRDALLSQGDLYASENPAKFWVQGDVSDKAHITLHGGLLTLAYLQKDNVDEVLDTWVRPTALIPDVVTFFPSPDASEPGYAAIVVTVEDLHLDEAHARLSYLPHVNTFPVYQAHMTLCYVKLEVAQHWCDVLNLATIILHVKEGDLDYGSEH